MTVIHTSLNLKEEEKEYLKKFQELHLKYNDNDEELKVELLVLDREYKNLVNFNCKKSLYLSAKQFLSFNKKNPEIELLEGFAEIGLSKGLFSKLKMTLNFPTDTNFIELKYREPYILISGDDNLVRVFKYEKGNILFLKEFGHEIKNNFKDSVLHEIENILHKISLDFKLDIKFDFCKDFLFISFKNILYIYNLKTDLLVLVKELPNNIEKIYLSEDNIVICSNNIHQKVQKISNNTIIWDIASDSSFKEDLYEYKSDEHSNDYIYHANKNGYILIKDINESKLYKIPFEVYLFLFQNTNIKSYNSEFLKPDLFINDFSSFISSSSLYFDDELYNNLPDQMKEKFLRTFPVNEYQNDFLTILKTLEPINPEKNINGYLKFDEYIIISYGDKIRIWHKNGKEKLLFPFIPKENNNFKVIDPNLKLYVFEDTFLVINEFGKVYGSENWKNYIYFVDGDEVKNYPLWESYYENIWDESIFEQL